MQKKILSFAITLGLITSISACQDQDSSLLLTDSQNVLAYAKKNKKSDWYETLPENLKAYYAPAQGKIGNDLFNSLHDIISANNNMESYVKTRAFIFSTLDNLTNRKNKNQTGVIDAYSQVFIPGAGEFSEGYREIEDENKDGYPKDVINAEHTWPQSFYGKSLPMVSDMHALQTVLSIPNVMRSDFPFGEVTNNVVYQTSCGSKLTLVDNQGKPVTLKSVKNYLNKKAGMAKVYAETGTEPTSEYKGVFEPCNDQKGNTSRALLYFYLRYHDMYIKQGSYDDNSFWKSKVPTFIKWSEVTDLADQREKSRNDNIFTKQGNRNPFIDIPNLASIIGEEAFLSH